MTAVVLLELVEHGFIASQDIPPLAHSPVLVIKGPRQTVCHMSVSKERLVAGDTRAESEIFKHSVNGA